MDQTSCRSRATRRDTAGSRSGGGHVCGGAPHMCGSGRRRRRRRTRDRRAARGLIKKRIASWARERRALRNATVIRVPHQTPPHRCSSVTSHHRGRASPLALSLSRSRFAQPQTVLLVREPCAGAAAAMTPRSAGGALFLALLLAASAAGEGSNWREEQARDLVPRVPGQAFNTSYAQYAGYVTVSEQRGAALFYWFFEAEKDPGSKPLVLWLNGGPGCSSIAFGLGEEVGPFHTNADGKGVHVNPYSWNKVANLLFVDSPVGVGYSYSNTSDDTLKNGDARAATDLLAFLLKWLERFPQYKEREFYLTGESYAGHYVPQLAQAIKRHHEATGDKTINLKGYMVGNALTDDFHDHYGIFQYMWTTGLISDQTYKLLNIFCDFESFVHTSPQCEKILDIASTEAGNIDSYSIFTPTCHASFAASKNKVMKRLHSVGKMGAQYDPCTEMHSTVYFNLAEVQKALHVNPVIGKSKWETCSEVVGTHWGDCERSVLHIYEELIQYGLRIWMFSGDTDAVIPVTSTRYSIDALKLPTVTPWRAWYDDDGEVGGWSQGYKGLTFVTVRGAGHEVPLHRPKQALTLIKSFLAGSPMPVQSNAHSDM